MKIGVLTLCRDRLEYTKTCFKALRQNAGCDYDHYVLDQGSIDGTPKWLVDEWLNDPANKQGTRFPICLPKNVGIHFGLNRLLDRVQADGYGYDLLVKVDNDCRVLTPHTLRAVAEHVLEDPRTPRVVSPLILGLRNRPGIYETRDHQPVKWNDPEGKTGDSGFVIERGVRLGMTRAMGGIFLPIPPSFVKAGFRYDETAPLWGGDDEKISAMAHEQGGYTAYLLDYEAEHIDTTEGQVAKYPEYFSRRVSEGGPAK